MELNFLINFKAISNLKWSFLIFYNRIFFFQIFQFHLFTFIDYKLDIEPVVVARADMR